MARFVALDQLRALAVVSMVQGHTFTVLLAEDALPRWCMQLHALVHGLTAPAFLFGAGLAFGITTYPHYSAHARLGPPLWRRLRRYALLVGIGYALQLPGASLLSALRMRGDALVPVLRVGPLHLIAVSLALCQISALALRPRVHAAAALALAVAIAMAAPLLWDAGASTQAGLLLGPWLDGRSGSLFPLFPWASFALLGVATGGLFTLAPRWRPSAALLMTAGALLAIASYVAFRAGVRLAPAAWFWQSSPLNVAFRVGLVLALLGLLQRASERSRTSASDESARTSTSAFLARHSLPAYVIHLLVLYGTPLTPSLHRRVGATLSAPEAALAFVLVLTVTIALTRLFTTLLERREAAWLQVAITLFVAAVLVR